MKRALVLWAITCVVAALISLGAPPVRSAPVLVQVAGMTGSNAVVTASITLTGAPAAGNLLVLVCANHGANGASIFSTVTNVSGSGVAWVQASDVQTSTFNDITIWFGTATTAAQTTKATFNTQTKSIVCTLAEFSGASATVDATTTKWSTLATNATPTTGNLTTTVANDLLVGAFYTGVTITTPFTPSSPWTLLLNTVNNAANLSAMGSAYQVVAGTGAFVETWTYPNGTGNLIWVGTAVAFEPAVAAPGGSPTSETTGCTMPLLNIGCPLAWWPWW